MDMGIQDIGSGNWPGTNLWDTGCFHMTDIVGGRRKMLESVGGTCHSG